MTAARSEVLALFRAVVRTSRRFPDRSMGKKLLYNARELIRLRRHEQEPLKIAQYLQDGHTALAVHWLLGRSPSLLAAITRKNATPHGR